MNPHRDQSTVDLMRAGLAGLADEAVPVDLHERVVRAARRSAVRRSVASATAAVLVLAGLGTAAWRYLPASGSMTEQHGAATLADTRITLSELREASFTIPPWPAGFDRCRSGPTVFSGGTATMETEARFPAMLVGGPRYLDVTDDGKVDTVALYRQCGKGVDDDQTHQVLALTRTPTGEIVVLGRMLAFPDGWTTLDPDDFGPESDGDFRFVRHTRQGAEAISVRWDGTGFSPVDSGVPVDGTGGDVKSIDWTSATVDIPANGTGCAAGRATFVPLSGVAPAAAVVGGTTYRLQPSLVYLDADRDGRLDVVLTLDCVARDVQRHPNLLLAVGRTDGQPKTIGVAWSADHREDGYPYQYAHVAYAGEADAIWLETRPWEGNIQRLCRITWNGAKFEQSCRP